MSGTPQNNNIVGQFFGELAHLTRAGVDAPAPALNNSLDLTNG